MAAFVLALLQSRHQAGRKGIQGCAELYINTKPQKVRCLSSLSTNRYLFLVLFHTVSIKKKNKKGESLSHRADIWYYLMICYGLLWYVYLLFPPFFPTSRIPKTSPILANPRASQVDPKLQIEYASSWLEGRFMGLDLTQPDSWCGQISCGKGDVRGFPCWNQSWISKRLELDEPKSQQNRSKSWKLFYSPKNSHGTWKWTPAIWDSLLEIIIFRFHVKISGVYLIVASNDDGDWCFTSQVRSGRNNDRSSPAWRLAAPVKLIETCSISSSIQQSSSHGWTTVTWPPKNDQKKFVRLPKKPSFFDTASCQIGHWDWLTVLMTWHIWGIREVHRLGRKGLQRYK